MTRFTITTGFGRLPSAPSLVGLRPEPVSVSAIRRPSTIAIDAAATVRGNAPHVSRPTGEAGASNLSTEPSLREGLWLIAGLSLALWLVVFKLAGVL